MITTVRFIYLVNHICLPDSAESRPSFPQEAMCQVSRRRFTTERLMFCSEADLT